MKNRVNILVVDDRPDGLLAIEAVLQSDQYCLIKASSGQEALSYLIQYEIALILLDVQMPVMNGFETARRIKGNEHWQHIPIIFLTAINKEVAHIYQGYECGAVDYLFKPFDPWVLKSKVSVFVELYLKNQIIIQQAKQLQEGELRDQERRMMELEVENLHQYRALANAIPHIVWRGKLDGSLDYFNEGWCKYKGVPLEPNFSQDWQSAIDPADRSRFILLWKDSLRNVFPFEMECRLTRHDGVTRWHLIRITFEKAQDGKLSGWIGTATDIHDLKEAEESLRRAQEQLEDRVQERTVELSQANHALKDEIMQRMKVQSEILEISEKEQQRIGQDLHDGLAQQLSGVSFKSKILQQKLIRKSLKEAEDATEILELVKHSISETRRLARGFYPIELERHGLLVALKELTINAEKMFNIICKFHWDYTIKISDKAVENHLYRIVQEAIHNAIKHGKATQIEIAMTCQDHVITLCVDDNGCGMPQIPARGVGMGMRTMEYRAKMIGACLDFQNRDKAGTRVMVTFQLADEEVPGKVEEENVIADPLVEKNQTEV